MDKKIIVKLRTIIGVIFLLTIIVFAFCIINNVTVYRYDAYNYWNLGKTFWTEGNFSLLSFPQSIRGYAWPLILGICYKIGLLFHHEYAVFWLFSSFVTVIRITVVFPKLFNLELGTIRWICGSILCVSLILFFWKDLILFPLSDFFAFALYMLILLLAKVMYHNLKTKSKYDIIIGSLVCFGIGGGHTLYII